MRPTGVTQCISPSYLGHSCDILRCWTMDQNYTNISSGRDLRMLTHQSCFQHMCLICLGLNCGSKIKLFGHNQISPAALSTLYGLRKRKDDGYSNDCDTPLCARDLAGCMGPRSHARVGSAEERGTRVHGCLRWGLRKLQTVIMELTAFICDISTDSSS